MRFPVISVLSIIIFLFESCGSKKESNPGAGITDKFSSISRAERFTLQKNDKCTIVTIIDPWQGANE